MKAHRKYDKPFFDRKKTDQVKPPQQLNSSPIPNGRTAQQFPTNKCNLNLSPTIGHPAHLKDASSCSPSMSNSNDLNVSHFYINQQQDITNNLSSTFSHEQTDQVKPLQQLNSSPIPNGRTVQQSLFDKSKFISSENNQQSPKSDSNLFHFDNLSILDPTQFDKKSASEKIPWKIEVTKSIISYFMNYFNVDDDIIVFSSDSYSLNWINSSYAIKKVMIFPVFPDKRKEWNYTYPSCLLNELIMFHSVPQNQHNKFCCVHRQNPKWKITI